MKAKRDKKFLSRLAKAISAELCRQHPGAPLRINTTLKPWATDTDGWAVTLGTFTGYQCWAEIWLDLFTAHTKRKVYYCVRSSKEEGLSKIIRAACKEFEDPLSIGYKDCNQNQAHFRLAKQLSKARFGRPVHERYPKESNFFYGIYEYDTTGLQRNEFARLVERVGNFFQTLAQLLTKKDSLSDQDIYRTVENRQMVVRHIHRERDSHAATLRKQKDNYICQICKFDSFRVYGTLGKDIAESHHIVPLSSNGKLRHTTVDDLITVCANCHRILDRMNGKPKDVDHLKSIVQKSKNHKTKK